MSQYSSFARVPAGLNCVSLRQSCQATSTRPLGATLIWGYWWSRAVVSWFTRIDGPKVLPPSVDRLIQTFCSASAFSRWPNTTYSSPVLGLNTPSGSAVHAVHGTPLSSIDLVVQVLPWSVEVERNSRPPAPGDPGADVAVAGLAGLLGAVRSRWNAYTVPSLPTVIDGSREPANWSRGMPASRSVIGPHVLPPSSEATTTARSETFPNSP